MFNSRLLASYCGILLVGCSLVNAAEPKNFKEIARPAPSREISKLAKDYMKGKVASAEAEAALKQDLTFLICSFTVEKNAPNLSRIQAQITSNYLRGSKSKQARSQMVAIVAQYAAGIAIREEYSPAARLNCLALLARLDETEETRDLPAKPARQALGTLIKIIEDPKQADYLKAISLYGLQRHVSVNWPLPVNGWNDEAKARIQKTLMTVLSTEAKVPSEMDAKTWLQRRAYDIFSNIHSPAAIDYAVKHLGEPERSPELRLSALKYLSSVDNAAMPEAKRKEYLISAAHFLRSQLIRWYELEDDKIKRTTGGGSGGYGGGYDGGGMGGIGGGGMGGLDGGDEGDDGYGGGYGGGLGGDGDTGSDSKPIDTQDWDTRIARRVANEIAQAIHIALNDVPLAEERPIVDVGTKPLLEASPEQQTEIEELIILVEAFQTAVNDAGAITDVTSLLQTTKEPIEDIMDFVKAMDGYSTKYPESVEEEDEVLKDADEPASQDPAGVGDSASEGKNPEGKNPGKPGGAPAEAPNAGAPAGGPGAPPAAPGTPPAGETPEGASADQTNK